MMLERLLILSVIIVGQVLSAGVVTATEANTIPNTTNTRSLLRSPMITEGAIVTSTTTAQQQQHQKQQKPQPQEPLTKRHSHPHLRPQIQPPPPDLYDDNNNDRANIARHAQWEIGNDNYDVSLDPFTIRITPAIPTVNGVLTDIQKMAIRGKIQEFVPQRLRHSDPLMHGVTTVNLILDNFEQRSSDTVITSNRGVAVFVTDRDFWNNP